MALEHVSALVPVRKTIVEKTVTQTVFVQQITPRSVAVMEKPIVTAVMQNAVELQNILQENVNK